MDPSMRIWGIRIDVAKGVVLPDWQPCIRVLGIESLTGIYLRETPAYVPIVLSLPVGDAWLESAIEFRMLHVKPSIQKIDPHILTRLNGIRVMVGIDITAFVSSIRWRLKP